MLKENVMRKKIKQMNEVFHVSRPDPNNISFFFSNGRKGKRN